MRYKEARAGGSNRGVMAKASPKRELAFTRSASTASFCSVVHFPDAAVACARPARLCDATRGDGRQRNEQMPSDSEQANTIQESHLRQQGFQAAKVLRDQGDRSNAKVCCGGIMDRRCVLLRG